MGRPAAVILGCGGLAGTVAAFADLTSARVTLRVDPMAVLREE